MTNFYIRNLETGKLELHFEKAAYTALDDAAKARVKSAFLWGRASGCWISRAKDPNLYGALAVARGLGLEDGGSTGERLSFAEQMERKAERAERRAERCDARAEAAAEEAERLQAPIRSMHSDVAFFTQPDINTSAGRAFTRRRAAMWASFERGIEEFRRSEYWQDRAKAARVTAASAQSRDKGFLLRRIRERESDIRALKRSVEAYEGYVAALEKGETPRDRYGWEVKAPREQLERQIGTWLDRMEAKLDELGYYQDLLDGLGGVSFSKDTLRAGDLLVISRHRTPVRFLRGGPKNFTFEYTEDHMRGADGTQLRGQASYAEIERRA